MESFSFTPAELTVPVGATVTWTNRHGARHDVVAADGTFTSPLFGEGETFSFTFTAPGRVPLRLHHPPGDGGHDHRHPVAPAAPAFSDAPCPR